MTFDELCKRASEDSLREKSPEEVAEMRDSYRTLIEQQEKDFAEWKKMTEVTPEFLNRQYTI